MTYNQKKILTLCLWTIPISLLVATLLKASPTDPNLVYSLQTWDCSTAPLASKAWCHFRQHNNILSMLWAFIDGLTTIAGAIFVSMVFGITTLLKITRLQKILSVLALIPYWLLMATWLTEPYKMYSLIPKNFVGGVLSCIILLLPIILLSFSFFLKNSSQQKKAFYTAFASVIMLIPIILTGLFLFLPYT